jgi:hypothetical protein
MAPPRPTARKKVVEQRQVSIPMTPVNYAELAAGSIDIPAAIRRIHRVLVGSQATLLVRRLVDLTANRYEDAWPKVQPFIDGLTLEATAQEIEACVVRISQMHSVEFIARDPRDRRSSEDLEFIEEMIRKRQLQLAAKVQVDMQQRLPHQQPERQIEVQPKRRKR